MLSVLYHLFQKKKSESGMVSVGIQNEGGHHSSSGSKKKAKTRTIICMDAALQTGWHNSCV